MSTKGQLLKTLSGWRKSSPTGSLLQPLLHKQLRLLAIDLMRLKKLWTSELAAATPLARRVTRKTGNSNIAAHFSKS